MALSAWIGGDPWYPISTEICVNAANLNAFHSLYNHHSLAEQSSVKTPQS